MTRNKASQIAQAILSEKGLERRLPVPVTDLAQNERVTIKLLTTERRFEGRLELCAGKPTIFVNDHGRGSEFPRTRFTLAHELGHFFLHRRWLSRGATFHDAEILSGDNLREVEREANDFAAECLLPERLVERFLNGRLLGLERIQGLAEQAQASIVATAIRVARITASRCCFFFEQDGVIQWVAPSDDWREARFVWSGWKGSMPEASHAQGNSETFEEREVPLQVWCPNAPSREEPLFESALQTSYGRLVLVFDGAAESLIG